VRATHHGQRAGHRAAIRAEGAAILVQHGRPVLAAGHAGQVHALQLVGVVRRGAGGGVHGVVRSGAGVVGEVGGQHVVRQGGGGDGRDVEVLVAQTGH